MRWPPLPWGLAGLLTRWWSAGRLLPLPGASGGTGLLMRWSSGRTGVLKP